VINDESTECLGRRFLGQLFAALFAALFAPPTAFAVLLADLRAGFCFRSEDCTQRGLRKNELATVIPASVDQLRNSELVVGFQESKMV
jgi:hypothetical protein